MMKFIAKNKKNIQYISLLILILILAFVYYFVFVKTKPNDRIIVTSSGTALFSNENPTFVVDFGNKENQDSQWIRFEASSSEENPFKTKSKKNIFTKIIQIFAQDKKSGIEMSLKGINFSETTNTGISKSDEDVKNVADILGTDDIKTTTQVIESGYDIATSGNEQNISKPTVVNANVAEGIDVEYQILQGRGLKEEIIIQNLDSFSDECKSDLTKCKLPLNTYTFDLKMDEGVSLNEGWYLVDGKTTKVYYFTDSNGKYLAHFLPSFAEDSRGNKTSNVNLDVVQTESGNYEIKVTVDSSWLLDANRVYPVRIDPSVVHDTSSDFSTGTFYATKYITGTELQIDDSSVVASWNMEETSNGTCSGGGDICDQSGNGYNATIAGSVTSVTSIDGRGRSFDGATGTLASVGDIGAFETNSFTIEAWVKKTGTCNAFYYCTILSKGSSGYEGWNFGLFGSSPVLDVRLNDKGPDNLQLLDGTTVLSDNTWYYVAVVVDGVNKNMKLYLNGQLEASGQYSATISYSSAGVKIGNSNTNSDLGFNGILDDVKFSNVAKSQSYIQNQYKKEVFGIYRSPIITINGNQNLTLSSLTSGVKTADGETPYSTTGLVAQWNFNETSGTTAVSGGTCGTSCNGTLTNMTTTGQDAAVNSGWTTNNRRWGAGALMFDGSNDYVSAGSNSSLDPTTALSIEAWIEPTGFPTFSGSQTSVIVSKGTTDQTEGHYDLLIYNNKAYFRIYQGGSFKQAIGSTVISSGNWYHIVGTWDGSTVKLYVNGILQGITGSLTSPITANAGILQIGRLGLSGYEDYFQGIIDSTRIYSRALTATEILSNYNVGNIEFQMRGGNTTNADDGTWGNWTTTTNETAMNSFDNSYLYNTSDSGLVAYWPMDEASGASVAEVKGSYTGTATGTTVVSGKYSNSRNFNGTSSDYVSVADNSNLSPSSITLAVWVKPTALPASGACMGIVDKRDTNDTGGYALSLCNSWGTQYIYWYTGNSWVVASATYTLSTGVWTQIVVTQTGTTVQFFINGLLNTTVSSGITALTNYAVPLYIGKRQSGSYFNGVIDEVQIYNSVLTNDAIKSLYMQGLSRNGIIAMEGTKSSRITNSTNIGLVSYWNFNETSGTSLADSVGGNTLTATGTTVTTGKYNLARSFNGTSDYASASSPSNIPIGSSSYTIETWMYPLATGTRGIVGWGNFGTNNQVNALRINSTNQIDNYWQGNDYIVTVGTITTSVWHHVAATYDGTNRCIYYDGVQKGCTASSGINVPSTANFRVGSTNSGEYFSGSLDDVKIYNIAKSADEILEEYNNTSTYYANYNFTSADLSTKTNLPFYVAADKPGSYISAIVGESAYANYQADSSTRGLWHLDEISGSGAYLKDSSGMNNNGTPTGTTYTSNGKFGGARSFSGVNYVNVGIASNLQVTSNVTYDVWVKANSWGTNYPFIVGASQYVNTGVMIYGNASGSLFTANYHIGSSDYGVFFNNPDIRGDGKWHHLATTYDGATIKTYFDGVLTNSVSQTGSITYNSSYNIWIGCRYGSGGVSDSTNCWNGSIDEFRISNTARTTDQIRQAYEVGLRTHDITIQFGARLSASNLIANSSDTSFTVDATAQGLTQMGSNLYTGDKLIVREVVSDTEYIAQGTVSAINAITGAATVNSWDTGSTFPTGGFTIKASVFKWEKQYLPIAGRALSTQIDAISLLTLRITNVYGGGNIWIDDLKSNGGYISTSGGTVDLGQAYQYAQYRAIFTSADGNVTPYLNQLQVDYVSDSPTMDKIMRHGKWFDNSGVKRSYWWVNSN